MIIGVDCCAGCAFKLTEVGEISPDSRMKDGYSGFFVRNNKVLIRCVLHNGVFRRFLIGL